MKRSLEEKIGEKHKNYLDDAIPDYFLRAGNSFVDIRDGLSSDEQKTSLEARKYINYLHFF